MAVLGNAMQGYRQQTPRSAGQIAIGSAARATMPQAQPVAPQVDPTTGLPGPPAMKPPMMPEPAPAPKNPSWQHPGDAPWQTYLRWAHMVQTGSLPYSQYAYVPEQRAHQNALHQMGNTPFTGPGEPVDSTVNALQQKLAARRPPQRGAL